MQCPDCPTRQSVSRPIISPHSACVGTAALGCPAEQRSANSPPETEKPVVLRSIWTDRRPVPRRSAAVPTRPARLLLLLLFGLLRLFGSSFCTLFAFDFLLALLDHFGLGRSGAR